MKNKENVDINEFLDELGLNTNEQKVYLASMAIGSSPASTIAREIDLPRQTTYSIIKNLVHLGLIDEGLWQGVKKFTARPSAIKNLLEVRRVKLEKLFEKTDLFTPFLTNLSRTKRSLPKITYYQGEVGLYRLLDDILDFYKNGGEKMFRGFGVNFFGKTSIKEKFYSFVQERYKYAVETRLIIAKGEDDLFVNNRGSLGREVKKIDIPVQNSAMYIVGIKIYIFSYEDEIGIMIENGNIADLLKTVFDAQWKMIK